MIQSEKKQSQDSQNHFEFQIKELQAQIEETKSLNEALMKALSKENLNYESDQLKKQDQLKKSRNQNESIDLKLKEKDTRITVLKHFRKVIELNVASLTCMHCNQSYSLHVFNRHLEKCNNNSNQNTARSIQHEKRPVYTNQNEGIINAPYLLKTNTKYTIFRSLI